MATIAPDVILVWTGTDAGIPTGYSRETSLDSKFIKGAAAGVDPNVTGGSATHTHTATANHSHTLNSHTHTFSLGAGHPASGTNSSDAGDATIVYNHTHGTTTSGTSSGGDLSSVSATYDSVSNDPPYYEAIFIKSDGTHGVPDDGICFVDDSTETPTGWQFCDGTNSSPDLRNKYLKGASTGADAGGTGGSYTNIHTLTHTHSVAPHTHLAATTGTPDSGARGGDSARDGVVANHTHSVTLDATTDTLDSAAPVLTTTETVEPAYTKLIPVQNQKGSDDAPADIIALWLGSLSNIPSNWILCDGTGDSNVDMRDRYLKNANLTSEAGNTGGSNTHTHASQSHTHTASGTHTHTGSVTHSYSSVNSTGGDWNRAIDSTTHDVINVSAVTATYSSASTAANSSSNEPEYRTVAFIKYTGSPGGAFLYNIL